MALGIDSERIRIQDDLRGLLVGDVLCDPLHVQVYASDASIYQIRPYGVVRPRSAADVVALVRYAAEQKLTLHPRGAGSGLAGEALGRGLIVDFSRYMRRWRRIDDRHVRVQPGLVLAELNRELANDNLHFGPDPATRSVTTLGSVLAIDASGSHWLRYGSARHKVRSLQVVMADGQQVEFNQHATSDPGRAGEVAHSIHELTTRYSESLSSHRCMAMVNRAGYRLDLAVKKDENAAPTVDLAKLLVGSEGTLGIITDATIQLDPIPEARGVLVLFFARLEHAARAALAITEPLRAEILAVRDTHREPTVHPEVSACDLMDRRLLEIARETDRSYDELIPKAAEALLLVEVAGSSLPEVRDELRKIKQFAQDGLQLAFDGRFTTDREERDYFWRLSRRVIPRLYRLHGGTRPLPFVEDIAVPPEHLPEFLVEVHNVLKEHRTTATVFCHAGHGQLHIRPFVDLANQEDVRRLRGLAEALYERVWTVRGTVCGEHAAGLSRSWVLPRQYGPLWPAMVQCKQLFDPDNRLNPGKVVDAIVRDPTADLRPVTAVIKVVPATDDLPQQPDVADAVVAERDDREVVLPVLLNWPKEQSLEQEARRCNGCGRCRTTSPDSRMCPLFRVSHEEEASPRAKANLMRGILSGQLSPEHLRTASMREIADTCFHCHQCRLECPASVDIPKLVTEIKAQHTAVNGLSFSDWLFTRLDLFAPLLGRLGFMGDWLLKSPRARWLIERTIGLSANRPIPPVDRRSFITWAARRSLTKPTRSAGRKVVLFVDYYVNWHDTQLGRALFEVMRHNRISVYVPPRQGQSWMPKIAAGDLRAAQKGAQQNIRILADAVRMGYHIVTPEATAALCLKHEYLNLVNDDDAKLVADNTSEACRYLWDLHRENQLSLDMRPVSAAVAYHEPCHIRAIDPDRPGEQLLRLIPRLDVHVLDKGCSGMAGTWGLQRQNYRNSLRIGWPVISALRRAPVQAAASECSACRTQLEHAANRPALHPVKLLAYAYGGLPELTRNLTFLE